MKSAISENNDSFGTSGQLLLPLEIFGVLYFLPHLLAQSGLSYKDNGDNLVPKELLKLKNNTVCQNEVNPSPSIDFCHNFNS